jgi:hypothetical protein
MTPEKRSPGRPRLYETSSAKVEAFRARQESAGYSRKEVLVTKVTADQLQALAKTHGVSATDVASALLEHGLAQYQTTASSTPSPYLGQNASGLSMLSGASRSMGGSGLERLFAGSAPLAAAAQSLRSASPAVYAMSVASASPGAGISEASSPLVSSDLGTLDPISNFFQRRKAPK